ncbi:DUF1624 domain-containing protein [Paludisphaera mucosa]|uniref:Heparan-alpha-glucosaminide N-acetyltransferase domain-containing protein n=1 Tax=Paludisphaera mucosa TaxID=3030827 RepID=A0ABT6F9V2_9BACT|nr:heparan-alpha-glucosaminide N-acetyltransferase domain-containing protein [Paludisphaera mucosa]MDG3004168.1 heparan-alpha-glucosaminide N-acetyltransferase domain-containing protein [Paludisphaera mucosa]
MMQSTGVPEPAPSPAAASARLEGVDLLRGLVMVVMVLDHTRDYFVDPTIEPTDLTQASPALFLSRWITHYCAPTFALLAGVGVRLAANRGTDSGSLARLLLTRGLWLILLEETVVKLGLFFRFDPNFYLGLVLWSIGGAFILLSPFVAARASAWLIGAIGLLIVVGHNALDAIPPDVGGALRPVVNFLFRPGVIALPGGMRAFVGYPLLPWFGVVAVGYGLGGVYRLDPRRRRAILATAGLAAIGLFIALRASGVYGDPQPWNREGDATRVALEFLNCTKYPPSLQFLLMTLGPALLALAAFDRGAGALGKPLVTLGRVPLFFYLLQWYAAHGLALVVAFLRGEPTGWLFVGSFPFEPPPSWPYSLLALYGWWMLVLAILYFPCAWFAGYKERHRGSAWLAYL